MKPPRGDLEKTVRHLQLKKSLKYTNEAFSVKLQAGFSLKVQSTYIAKAVSAMCSVKKLLVASRAVGLRCSYID